MKISRWFAIFLLLFASGLAASAQTNNSGEPPPPSNEYFPKTWVDYKLERANSRSSFPRRRVSRPKLRKAAPAHPLFTSPNTRDCSYTLPPTPMPVQ